MLDPGDDFGDDVDDEPRRPLLPPDDRVWRHPSELTSLVPPSPEETLLARRRWMQSTPSRSGARAAGIVGALLATGVVLVGTHLTSWLTDSGHVGGTRATLVRVTASTGPVAPAVAAVGVSGLLARATRALVDVRAGAGRNATQTDGVIISTEGYVLAPVSVVSRRDSISVVRSDGEELPATVTGVDRATGIAVLHVDERQLPTLAFDPSRRSAVPGTKGAGVWLLDAWRSGSVTYRLVRSTTPPKATSLGNGPALLERCPRSLALEGAPSGAVVIGASGRVEAVVMAHRDGGAIAAPGWLALRVAEELIRYGAVTHGWLGIEGTTGRVSVPRTLTAAHPGSNPPVTDHTEVTGVRVRSLMPDSAAGAAGLRPGDLIERINGRRVTSMAALQADLYLMRPSAPVTLEVREGSGTTELHTRLRPAA